MKASFTFRVYATDQTEFWELGPDHPLTGRTAWGIYFFCEGEATHLCSLTPSSRCDWLRNQFDLPADYDTDSNESAELEGNSGGEWTTYFGFIRPRDCRDYVSGRYTWTLDSADYENCGRSDGFTSEDVRRAAAELIADGRPTQFAYAKARRDLLRNAAYELAREYFSGNHVSPACTYGAGLARHLERKAAAAAAREAAERRRESEYEAQSRFLARLGLSAAEFTESRGWVQAMIEFRDSPEFLSLPAEYQGPTTAADLGA